MPSFSASEAAFEGFRTIRRYPVAFAVWMGLLLVFTFAMIFIGRAILGGDFATVVANSQANPHDTTAALATVSRMAPFGLFASLISVVAYSVFAAGVFRAVLRPDAGGVGFLAFGADELRLIGLSFIYMLLGLALYIVLILAVVLLIAALAAMAAAGGGQSASSGVLVGLLGFVGIVAVLCLMVWLMVRLSLAGPMTFAQRRIAVFGSWSLTKGRFWSLFGCYLLAVIFGIIISLVGAAVGLSLHMALSGGDPGVFTHMFTGQGYGAMAGALTLGLIAQTLVSVVFNTVQLVVFYGAMAAAYRGLASPPEDVAAVFGDPWGANPAAVSGTNTIRP